MTQEHIVFFAMLFPSIILHEVSHGWVAFRFGDDTAKRAGRLTLNPIAHIDIFGTIILPFVLIITTGRAFGYAKPVPVNFHALRHPRRDMVLVAIAGPVTNSPWQRSPRRRYALAIIFRWEPRIGSCEIC